MKCSMSEGDKLRQLQFLELRVAGKTLQQIGDMYNLSRERVRQVIAAYFVQHPDPELQSKIRHYQKGGKILPVVCANCGIIFKPKHNGRRFCGRRCASEAWSKSRRVSFICEGCGKVCSRTKSDVRVQAKRHHSPPRFCDNRCEGKVKEAIL